jgi:hypothetical protein
VKIEKLISCTILNKTKKTGFINEKFRFLPLAILKKPRQSLQRSKLAWGSFPPKAAKLAGQNLLSGRLRAFGTTKGVLPRFFTQVQDLRKPGFSIGA